MAQFLSVLILILVINCTPFNKANNKCPPKDKIIVLNEEPKDKYEQVNVYIAINLDQSKVIKEFLKYAKDDCADAIIISNEKDANIQAVAIKFIK